MHRLMIGLLFILSACSQATDDYQLKHVQDGDSLILCCDSQGKDFIVRLRDIDAPEKGQPYANQSRAFLQQLVKDKPLKLHGNKKDKYGRLLADILIEDTETQSVSQQMIVTGHAWVWRYSDNMKFQYLQNKAKQQKLGLWALPESQRVEPWEWRKHHPRNKK